MSHLKSGAVAGVGFGEAFLQNYMGKCGVCRYGYCAYCYEFDCTGDIHGGFSIQFKGEWVCC
jgi:hypothetical protein